MRAGLRAALVHAHPVLVAAVWLLGLHASTAAPVWVLPRPLIVAVGVAGFIYLGAMAVTRRIPEAAILASAIVTLLVGAWPVTLAIWVLLAWLALVDLLRRRRGEMLLHAVVLPRLSASATLASAVLLAVIVAQTAATGGYWYVPGPGNGPEQRGATANLPSMYIVMLDGYPGVESVRDRFEIDLGPFVAQLEDRGFDVPREPRSNYSTTWLSLASLFQMAYAHDLPEMHEVSPRGPQQYRVAGRLMNTAPVLADLRARGYHLVSSQSPYSDIALTNADVVVPAAGLTWFEEIAVEESVLARASGSLGREWLATSQREAIEVALQDLGNIAARSDLRPAFVFAHVFAPHPPFLFHADGSRRAVPACFPGECTLWEGNLTALGMTADEYVASLKGQVTYLNRRLLESIDRLLAADPGAVIVLISDHGSRYDRERDPEETVSNFLAARTPGHEDLFPDDAHLVNTLPTLLNAYLRTSYPTLEFRAWISDLTILDLVPLEEAMRAGPSGHTGGAPAHLD